VEVGPIGDGLILETIYRADRGVARRRFIVRVPISTLIDAPKGPTEGIVRRI